MKPVSPRTQWRPILKHAVICTLTLSCTGCVFPSKPTEPVGSTHIAVLSATVWDDYRDRLTPSFNLDAKSALAAVVPDTLQIEQSMLDAFRAKARIALAPSDVLTPGFGEPGESDATRTSAGGSLPGLSLSEAPPAALPGAPTVIDRAKLGSDPFLQHLAATALFQEVRLLERYVQDAVQRDGYRAYVVRLQITNMPYQRDTPFDTYANIAFFMSPVEQPSTFGEIIGTPGELFEMARGAMQAGKYDDAVWYANLAREQLRRDKAEKRKSQDGSSPNRSSVPPNPPPRGAGSQPIGEVPGEVVSQAESVTAAIAPPLTAATTDEDSGSTPALSLPDETRQPNAPDEDARTDRLLNDIEQLLEVANAVSSDVPKRLPVVVPLLVTDHVEAALTSQRAEQLKQLGLALAAAYAGIGGSIDLEQLDRAVRSSVGRDYNSLFTVARMADNVLRIRIGARQAMGDIDGLDSDASQRRFFTVPQTHNISLLLLVPMADPATDAPAFRGRAPVYVGLRTEYRNPESGKRLASHNGSTHAALRALIERQGFKILDHSNETNHELLNLAADAQNGRYSEFSRRLAASPHIKGPSGAVVQAGHANQLWTELVAARIGSVTDVTEFHVPLYTTYAGPSRLSDEAFVIDNGEHATAIVDGVGGIDPVRTSAIWTVRWNTSGGDVRESHLASTAATLTGRHQLTLTFPSLLKHKLAESSEDRPAESTIVIRHDGVKVPLISNRDATELAARLSFPVVPKPSTVMMTASKSTIVLPPQQGGGRGTEADLTLAFLAQGPLFAQLPSMSDDGLRKALTKGGVWVVTVDGASFTVPPPQAGGAIREIPGTTGQLVIMETGSVPIRLTDLSPDTKVRIILTSPRDTAGSMTREIVIK